MLDIAFGHIESRRSPATTKAPAKDLLSGIRYGPKSPDSWVCFVEAKYLSDCAYKTRYDHLRNQLARVIENLLCFQTGGEYPAHLHFALLTPRVFKDHPSSRMYGYKMADYADVTKILSDMNLCELPTRVAPGYKYPGDLTTRIKALAPVRWVTFEDVLATAGLGDHFDVVRRPKELDSIHDEIVRRLAAQRDAPTV